jgi:hexosaminidase
VLLRRLARGADTAPLETLVSVVGPVKEYRRYQQRPQTMLSPLTGLVDAARADAEAARRFNSMADGLLSDAPRFGLYAAELRDTLTRWRDAGAALGPIIDGSPALHEARPLARDLSELGAAGLEALSYLSRGTAPPDEWRDTKLALLAEAAKPKAAVEFAVVPAVRRLVLATSELPRLKELSPAEWKARVDALASPPAKKGP